MLFHKNILRFILFLVLLFYFCILFLYFTFKFELTTTK